MNTLTGRTWAEIDLENIRRNVREIKRAIPENTRFLGVVKADAYGHGAVPVAKAILEAGGDYLAVACASEAIELRQAGINAPVLILGVTPPEFAGELAEMNITQSVPSLAYAKKLSDALDRPLKCHLKLDSGMGRIGFCCKNGATEDMLSALEIKKLDFEGVFTHFAVSDEPEKDFTAEQFRRFGECVDQLEQKWGRRFCIRHCANSGAVINFREYSLDMVRPGLMTYGLYPALETGGIRLFPAMSLKSRIYAINHFQPGDSISYGRSYIAETPISVAVVPIGYADGLSRSLSGRMDMLIRGVRCPQIGRICMDMCMVDVSAVPDCREGDIVTIIGQDGNETIPVEELADTLGTISYELTCGVAPRVPRVYLG